MKPNYINYNKFVARLLVNSDEIDENFATDCVRLACIDFCENSQVLKRYGTDDIHNGLTDYCLDIDLENEAIKRIDYFIVDGTYYKVINDTSQLAYGDNCCYLSDDKDVIVINKALNYCKKCAIKYKITIVPTANSCGIDEFIFNNYYNTILNGALYHMHITRPSGKWFNWNLAQHHLKLFREQIDKCYYNKEHGFSNTDIDIGQLNI